MSKDSLMRPKGALLYMSTPTGTAQNPDHVPCHVLPTRQTGSRTYVWGDLVYCRTCGMGYWLSLAGYELAWKKVRWYQRSRKNRLKQMK
jgi:hypothetical protein